MKMASSNRFPQFIKYICCDESSSDEIRVPQKFTNEHSKRLSENWILSLHNGYKIPVRYDSTKSTLVGVRELLVDFGVMGGEVLVFEQVDKGNFKLYIVGVDGCEMKYPVIMHASQQTATVEVQSANGKLTFLKFDVPLSFAIEFATRMPSSVKYVLNNAAQIEGSYDEFKRTLGCLIKVRKVLGLRTFTAFDCLLFKYDGRQNFKLSFFDGRNVEILLDTVVMRSGNLCFSLRCPSHFSVQVMPCHMMHYSHGVDVSTDFFRLSVFWKKKDTITAYNGIESWKLEVRKRKFGERATINRGWIEFRDDLGLNVGDKCWFKWIDDSYHCFRVEVVRAVPVID
ncbi:hypothetical protein ACET3Z_018302 [Daucus carota]